MCELFAKYGLFNKYIKPSRQAANSLQCVHKTGLGNESKGQTLERYKRDARIDATHLTPELLVRTSVRKNTHSRL